MVQFVHQGQQAANFTRWKAFARKPVKVVAWQIGDQAAFMLAKRHGAGDEKLQGR